MHRMEKDWVWGDYDNDDDPDIFVANDTTPNFLYQNNSKGIFQNIGLFAGVALSTEGRPYSGEQTLVISITMGILISW